MAPRARWVGAGVGLFMLAAAIPAAAQPQIAGIDVCVAGACFCDPVAGGGVAGAGCVADSATVDPSASIGAGVTIGDGAVVGPGVDVGAGAALAAGVVLRRGAAVGRRAVLGEGAVVDFGAAIGDGAVAGVQVRVGPHAAVGADARIGARARIGALATLGEGARVGTGSRIGSGARIGPFLLAGAGARIGWRSQLGEQVTLGTAAWLGPRADVGARVTVAAEESRGGGVTTEPPPEELDCDRACASRRIGRRAGASCPAPAPDPTGHGGWTHGELFATQNRTAPLPPALAPYCLYAWVPAVPGVRPVHGLLPDEGGRAPDEWLGCDCPGVVQLASRFASLARSDLTGNLRRQVAAVSSLPGAGDFFPPGTGPAPIRVAVVDTTPTAFHQSGAATDSPGGLAGVDTAEHGAALGRLIRTLACPDEDEDQDLFPCAARVSNHLALSHVALDAPDATGGGYFGHITELAAGIGDAVGQWDEGGSGQQHLIINMSVGWDPSFNADPRNDEGIAAVRAALEDAACAGALIVAAAGNSNDGPDPGSGPMYPAAFELEPAPAACPRGAGAGNSTYWPLVYSAGGLRGNDAPLVSTRPGGRPRLAAPAEHATADARNTLGGPVFDGDLLAASRPLTGTSVAAAVTSSVAAIVWSYRPELTAAEVMDIVYGSALDLGIGADYCLGGAACAAHTIRRVALCKALIAACDTAPPDHPTCSLVTMPACPARPPFTGPTTTLQTALAAITAYTDAEVLAEEAAGTTPDADPSAAGLADQGAVCAGADLFTLDPDPPMCPDPTVNFANHQVTPWVLPQPGSDGCPVCVLLTQAALSVSSQSGTAYIDIDPDITYNLTATVMAVRRKDGTKTLHDLTPLVGTLTGGSTRKVTGIELAKGSDVESVILDFTVEAGKGSLSDTIIYKIGP